MKNALQKSAIFVVIIWAVYLIDSIFNLGVVSFGGILPRSISSLKGVLLSCFVHANLYHIISNTVPLFILLTILFSFYGKNSIRTIFLITIIGGIGVWIFARNSYHVGASGLIYGLVTFLITKGIVIKKFKPLIIAVIVAFSYGGLIWGVFPTYSFVSWEGHLFGAIAGVVVAKIK